MLDAVWLIPALPLLGFALIVLGNRRLGEPWAGWLATLMVAGSFAAGVVTFAGLLERRGLSGRCRTRCDESSPPGWPLAHCVLWVRSFRVYGRREGSGEPLRGRTPLPLPWNPGRRVTGSSGR